MSYKDQRKAHKRDQIEDERPRNNEINVVVLFLNLYPTFYITTNLPKTNKDI